MQQLPATFEDYAIRRVYDEATETWWFSVVDIVQVLTQQPDFQAARNYWKVLKNRLTKEGSELVTNCNQLKMPAGDGQQRLTDVAMPQTLLRQVQFATDAHRWTQIKTCRPYISLSLFIAVHRWLPSFFRLVMKSQSEEFIAGKAKILFNRDEGDEGDEGDKSIRGTLVFFSSPSSLLSLFKTSFLPDTISGEPVTGCHQLKQNASDSLLRWTVVAALLWPVCALLFPKALS